MKGFASFPARGGRVLTWVGCWLLVPVLAAAEPEPRSGSEPPTPEVQAEASPPCPPAPDAKKPASIFDNVPVIHPTPRLGFFTIPPAGPGYYSGLDWVLRRESDKPPPVHYSPVAVIPTPFFDADFRFVDQANRADLHPFDRLKRIPLGDDWMFSWGGEFRYRHMNEVDSRLLGRDNHDDLYRTRTYGDLWFRDIARLYVEYIDAQSFGQILTPLGIDINHSDFLNLFVELKLGEIDGKPVYVRGGRQEMLFGSQRLISSLDWANTRRTFQGVRAYRKGENLDVDAFWVQPVTTQPYIIDSIDDALNFSGIWATYRPHKDQAIDAYVLNLDRNSPSHPLEPQVPGGAGLQAPVHYNITTLGSRYVGILNNHLLWDCEGMIQVGAHGRQDLFAYAFTTSAGYNFPELPLTPQLWAAFDYASGDNSPGQGTYSTFNQLFPSGHAYFGFIDDVGRQNIQDLSFALNYFPAHWITGQIQFHNFWLAQPRDALYNAGGRRLREDPSGRAGRDVGQEIDFIWSFHLTGFQDVFVGYSKLFAGSFIKETGNPESPELFYVQYNLRW